eukprot:1187001-Prorocentrum_minimum.AAC.1
MRRGYRGGTEGVRGGLEGVWRGSRGSSFQPFSWTRHLNGFALGAYLIVAGDDQLNAGRGSGGV